MSRTPAALAPRAAALAVATCASLAGCAGLPPKSAPPTLRAQAPLSADELGAAPVGWPAANWWQRYSDPTLDTLIQRALATSPSLAAAQARFEAAGASVRTANAAAGPQAAAQADMTRQRLSDHGLLPPQFLGFHWYNQADLGLTVNYTFDWWGKQRAAIAAAVDAQHAAQADHEAAALTLASSIAQDYFGWQTDQARLQLVRAGVANLEHQYAIATALLRAQITRVDDIRQLESSAAAAREQQIALENSARLRLIMLAALLNVAPAELPPLVPRPLPAVSAQLPTDVSLDLIARRANIEASRWRVEAAARNIEVARAGFMPDISLNALLGLSSIELSKLLEIGSAAPQFGAALHLPIFDAGLLRGRYDNARAQLAEAIATYDDAVVTAAREVGSQALARQDYGARRAERVAEMQISAAQRTTAAQRARQGLTDARPELLAEAQWLTASDNLLQLDAAALDADVTLIQALGGGYQRQDARTAHIGERTP